MIRDTHVICNKKSILVMCESLLENTMKKGLKIMVTKILESGLPKKWQITRAKH